MAAGLATLWIGSQLSPLERLSLTSLVNHGHRVTLYSYRPVDGVPDGVTCSDASDILSGEPILRYTVGGSPALHSDYFRLQLMQKTPDVWVDADIIAVDRLPVEEDFLLSFEGEHHVGNAVMRLPEDSPTLRSLSRLFRHGRGWPPKWGASKKTKQFLRTGKIGIPMADWPYGETGPVVLTKFLRKSGEISQVMPQHTFFPVDYFHCRDLITPGGLSASQLPHGCKSVHCFAKALKIMLNESHEGVPPEGSFLLEQYQRHKVDPSPAQV